MQNKFAGDIGDYAKFGLLRWLSGMLGQDNDGILRLGVNWHLVPNSGGGAGGFTQFYTLRNCDPRLFLLLQAVAKAKCRCVADIQRSIILPPSTLYYPNLPDPSLQKYPDYLTFDGILRSQRPDARCKWAQKGLDALADAELVLIDPDNGLQVPAVGRYSRKGPKYAYYDDLQPYWKRGQSLIIYQHANMMPGGVDALATKRCKELRGQLPGATLHALRFRRRSTRLFLVAAQPKHAVILDARVRSFLNSCWGKGPNPHFTKAPC